VIAAGALVLLLLQAGTNSWRAAVTLFVVTPLAGAGALLAAGLVGGAWAAGVLAAVLTVVALAVRQSLVLVRRAQERLAAGDAPAAALRAAAGEQTAPVVIAVLGTAAAVLPAAVLGGAGLEALRPFAVGLLGGLVTGTAVVLLLVPTLLAAVGGLRPLPVVGPDTPDGEPADLRHAQSDDDVTVPAPRAEQAGQEVSR